jgi:hypothetical protein
MLHGDVLVQSKTMTTAPFVSPPRAEVHKAEMMAVLERAADDPGFISQLIRRGSDALAGYELSWREKAALLSGDIAWIETQLGALDARLCTWLNCRLQQERW